MSLVLSPHSPLNNTATNQTTLNNNTTAVELYINHNEEWRHPITISGDDQVKRLPFPPIAISDHTQVSPFTPQHNGTGDDFFYLYYQLDIQELQQYFALPDDIFDLRWSDWERNYMAEEYYILTRIYMELGQAEKLLQYAQDNEIDYMQWHVDWTERCVKTLLTRLAKPFWEWDHIYTDIAMWFFKSPYVKLPFERWAAQLFTSEDLKKRYEESIEEDYALRHCSKPFVAIKHGKERLVERRDEQLQLKQSVRERLESAMKDTFSTGVDMAADQLLARGKNITGSWISTLTVAVDNLLRDVSSKAANCSTTEIFIHTIILPAKFIYAVTVELIKAGVDFGGWLTDLRHGIRGSEDSELAFYGNGFYNLVYLVVIYCFRKYLLIVIERYTNVSIDKMIWYAIYFVVKTVVYYIKISKSSALSFTPEWLQEFLTDLQVSILKPSFSLGGIHFNKEQIKAKCKKISRSIIDMLPSLKKLFHRYSSNTPLSLLQLLMSFD